MGLGDSEYSRKRSNETGYEGDDETILSLSLVVPSLASCLLALVAAPAATASSALVALAASAVAVRQPNRHHETTVGPITVDGRWRVVRERPVVRQAPGGPVGGVNAALVPATQSGLANSSAVPLERCSILITAYAPYREGVFVWGTGELFVSDGCNSPVAAMLQLQERKYVPGYGDPFWTMKIDKQKADPGAQIDLETARYCDSASEMEWGTLMTFLNRQIQFGVPCV